MNDPAIIYNDEGVRSQCSELNLKVDEQALAYVNGIFAKHDAPQRLFDEATRYHARLINHYFTPSNYSWKQRIQFAFYFLTGVGR
jgi:hypothetical protein